MQTLIIFHRVLGVIGGFHLFNNYLRLPQTIAYFREKTIGRIYPSHCVPLAAKAEMFRDFPVFEVGVGLTINYSTFNKNYWRF